MAMSTVFPTFYFRSDPEYSSNHRPEHSNSGRFTAGKSQRRKPTSASFGGGLSSLIFKFPPNFVRQLSIKARRNCSNIGVAQVVAASWSCNPSESVPPPAAAAVDFTPTEEPSVINGERLGRGIVTDAITTPVVNTSAYFFKKTSELIDFKEGRHSSFEYGRYGNPTTVVAEEKISALEGAEATLLMASGMCASTIMLMALVPGLLQED